MFCSSSVVLQLDPSLEAKVNPQKQAVILEEEYEVRRARRRNAVDENRLACSL